MSPETLAALNESIEHWKAVEADPVPARIGAAACALCRHFLQSSCGGCPVAEAGHPRCTGTPYFTFLIARNERASRDALARYARQEVDFLESLRPREGAPVAKAEPEVTSTAAEGATMQAKLTLNPVPPNPNDIVTLTMTRAEAEDIAGILACIGGRPSEFPARNTVSHAIEALAGLGLSYTKCVLREAGNWPLSVSLVPVRL